MRKRSGHNYTWLIWMCVCVYVYVHVYLACMCACTCKCMSQNYESVVSRVKLLKVKSRHCHVIPKWPEASRLIDQSSFFLPVSRDDQNSTHYLLSTVLLDSLIINICSVFLYSLTLLQLGGVSCTVQFFKNQWVLHLIFSYICF